MRVKAGDLPERLARAQDVAAAAVVGIAAAQARADFETSFDGLSEGVQAAILGELSMLSPGYVKEASADEIELFATTEEGEALVREWGGSGSRKAAHNVGMIRAKMRAVVDGMSAADNAEFTRWFDNLTSGEVLSALRAIVTT